MSVRPAHSLMNASFVVLGLTMILGSALIYPAFNPARWTAAGFGLFAIGGGGVVMAGVFPEDTVSGLHGSRPRSGVNARVVGSS